MAIRGGRIPLLPAAAFERRRCSLCFCSLTQAPADETLVSTVASVLREHRSRSRWNYLKSLYPAGFSSAEVSQITLRIKNNPRLALRFFLWSEQKCLCSHDLLSYSTIIHILARCRLKSAAGTLIQKAIRVSESTAPFDSAEPPELFAALVKSYRVSDSAPFVFDLLVDACLQVKKIDRAMKIVRMLRSRGISPMIPTCNSLIRSFCRLRGSDAGFSIYKELFREIVGNVSPRVQTFNTLLLSFLREEKMEMLEEIWKEMEEFGCEPNVFSYSILLASSCDQGKIAQAVLLWEEMRRRQIEPDIVAYNTMIKGFCGTRQVDKAETLLQDMVLHGMEPSCATYEHLIKGHCSVGDVASALLIYKDMCRKDFRPEATTIDELIRELCRQERVCEGVEVFTSVMQKEGFFPSSRSYVFLIAGLCKDGRMEEALKLQAEMVGNGFKPDIEVYNAFIGGYQRKGDLDIAKRVQIEMVEMDF